MKDLEKQYFDEFKVIDGVNQHPEGIDFETWIREKKLEAQNNYCFENNMPRFADGYCSCGRDLYKNKTIESAGNEAITGCGHCCKSFCR